MLPSLDQKQGYVAGGANGAGAEILQSTDGGKTFKNIEGIKFGLDLLLLAAEAAKNTVIVAGTSFESRQQATSFICWQPCAIPIYIYGVC